MLLVFAPINTDLKIVKIFSDEKTKKHLESLGITINSNIRVMNSTNGSVILKIKDSKLALDNDIARKIMIA